MKKISLALLLFLSVTTYGQQKIFFTSSKFLNKIPHNGTEKTKFTYKLIPSANNTFGYDVFADNIIILHQQQMPGKADGVGFSGKEDAIKVAQRVILKLNHPIVQPVVSTTELQLLGIR